VLVYGVTLLTSSPLFSTAHSKKLATARGRTQTVTQTSRRVLPVQRNLSRSAASARALVEHLYFPLRESVLLKTATNPSGPRSGWTSCASSL